MSSKNKDKIECPTQYNPISMYLMASYAYYYVFDPIMTDEQFDMLGRYLLESIDDLPDHPHKHLITKDDLRAGTYLGDYPDIVCQAVQTFREQVDI